MAGKKNPTGQPPVNKGKKNPAKDTGATSVNPVEGDEEPPEDEESDTDVLSHLPTDEESGPEDEGAGEANGDVGDQ